MFISLVIVTVSLAGEFSPLCPSTIDNHFVDNISRPDDGTWQTPLSEETLDEIRDVIEKKGPLVDHIRTLTSTGVQCWYKMPKSSSKKLDFVIQTHPHS